MYAKPAVRRFLEPAARIVDNFALWPLTRLGFLVILQHALFARCEIIAGWLVVLVYGLPVATYRLAMYSLIALPMPTP